MKALLPLIIVLVAVGSAISQNLAGFVKDGKQDPVEGALVSIDSLNKSTVTDKDGYFVIKKVPVGTHQITVSHVSFTPFKTPFKLSRNNGVMEVTLSESFSALEPVLVSASPINWNGIARKPHTDGEIMYASKKNDQISLDQINGNKALNNPREVFARVPGINIWENDGSGIQLGIGARGLSPNRSWEFNVRQNGYDISSDIFGYPEAYFTPPVEALSSIEIIKGASGLQFGSQMGGMVNFVVKKPSEKPVSFETRNTRGSFNMFNSYNALSGTVGKFSYHTYYNTRSADGWRENSNYKVNTGYVNANYQLSKKASLGFELTGMEYLMRQPGGLTDSMFRANPKASLRERNWMQVKWYVPALNFQYQISNNSSLSVKAFGLYGERNSVGFISPITVDDNLGNRDVLKDRYQNIGLEIRNKTSYTINNTFRGVVVSGARLYNGNTLRRQGSGSNGNDANFTFNNPDNLEGSNFDFASENVAFFVENAFYVGPRLLISQGFRYEYINTTADGYYQSGGNRVNESLDRQRRFPLFSVGAEYHVIGKTELYTNVSEGYRAIHFNDVRVTNPSLVVDENITDSKGWNFDLGYRGHVGEILNFDVSYYVQHYGDRLGTLNRTNDAGTAFQFRTNVADSRASGVEAFTELFVSELFSEKPTVSASVFASYSYNNARFVKSELESLRDKKVELAPNHILRAGITAGYRKFRASLNYNQVSEQFSDANNTQFTVNGNNGLIPSYSVWDFSTSYRFKMLDLSAGVNNLTNEMYFTRRAGGYPGPGLIPADGRSFYISVGAKF